MSFFSLIVCQFIKFLIESIRNKRIEWQRLFSGSGGMPSTHTSFSSSLTMLIGFKLGFDSVYFAIALVFTLITSYDALGVRYESGRHAEALNYLLSKKTKTFKEFKEKLGHEPLEVLVGFLLGTFIAFIFNSL